MRVSSPKELNAIQSAMVDLAFLPTSNMMKVKATFYANWHGMHEPKQMDVVEVTGVSTVKDWWPKAGFKEWFLNKDTTKGQLKYLKELSLKVAEDILLDPEANTNAKVNLIKNILIYNEALEQRELERATIRINEMSTEDIQKRLKEYVIEAEESSDEKES